MTNYIIFTNKKGEHNTDSKLIILNADNIEDAMKEAYEITKCVENLYSVILYERYGVNLYKSAIISIDRKSFHPVDKVKNIYFAEACYGAGRS